MNNHGEVSLETDHLEEVIDTPPPGQPVVLIQYRTRGLPWYVILPLFAVVALLAAAGSYSFVASRARPYPFSGPPGGPVVQTVAGPLTSPSPEVVAADLAPGPLSLNTQPVGPVPPPAAKVTQETPKPADPPKAASSAPGPTKTQPPLLASNTTTKPAEPATAVVAPVAPASSGDISPPAVAETPDRTTRPGTRNPLALGFSIPPNGQSPFDSLPISPKTPGLPLADDRQEPSTERALADPAEPNQAPTPSREELAEQIRAEAAEKNAELNQLRDLKSQARGQVDAESQARVDEERATFHDQLSQIVRSRSSEAGKQIDDLCNQYGRAYDKELRAKVAYLLSHMNGRTSRDVKVKFLRDRGVPEPAILDFLANEIKHYINSRNGPRDSNEVRVNAARMLLSFKLPKNPGGASKVRSPLLSGPARSSLPAGTRGRAEMGTP